MSMIDPSLIEYIKTQLASGVEKDTLKTALMREGGWSVQDVEEVFLSLNPPAPRLVTPVQEIVSAPRAPVPAVQAPAPLPAAFVPAAPVSILSELSSTLKITTPPAAPAPTLVTPPRVASPVFVSPLVPKAAPPAPIKPVSIPVSAFTPKPQAPVQPVVRVSGTPVAPSFSASKPVLSSASIPASKPFAGTTPVFMGGMKPPAPAAPKAIPTPVQTQVNKPAPSPVVSDSFDYAGFWRRLAALFADSVFLMFVSFVVGGFIYFFANNNTVIGAASIGMSVFTVFYFVLMEASAGGGTIGKRIFEIKVVDYSGEKISILRSLARYLSKILSSIFFIGFIMAAFTKRKQGLHDFIAKTLVVRR